MTRTPSSAWIIDYAIPNYIKHEVWCLWHPSRKDDDSLGIMCRVHDDCNYYVSWLSRDLLTWDIGKVIGGSYVSLGGGAIPQCFMRSKSLRVRIQARYNIITSHYLGDDLVHSQYSGTIIDNSLSYSPHWGILIPQGYDILGFQWFSSAGPTWSGVVIRVCQ